MMTFLTKVHFLSFVVIGVLACNENECESEQDAVLAIIEQYQSCEVAEDCVVDRPRCVRGTLACGGVVLSREGATSQEYQDAVRDLHECRGECATCNEYVVGSFQCQQGQCVWIPGDEGTAGNGGYGATSSE